MSTSTRTTSEARLERAAHRWLMVEEERRAKVLLEPEEVLARIEQAVATEGTSRG